MAIALVTEVSQAARVAVIGAPSEAEVEASAVTAPGPAAAGELPASEARVAAGSEGVAGVVVAEDKRPFTRRKDMNPKSDARNRLKQLGLWSGVICAYLLYVTATAPAQTAKAAPEKPMASTISPMSFATPQQAADALIEAAGSFDVARLEEIFGTEGRDIVFTGETGQDRELAQAFAAKAHEKERVSVGPTSRSRAFLLVGEDDWPFPAPLVNHNNLWRFDVKAGRQEILYRRVGRNELDAIEICRGYVDAQHEYALEKRQGYDVNQYAQRIISTPGKQDGLAWRNPDGAWGGPIGENVALAIEQGYTNRAEPYHGYFFKVLKGQGAAAPLGRMDFVINGVMIGGFAMVASPAEYGVTGIKSFIVSHDGVVYEKDLGPDTLNIFKSMELFNPDKTWDPVRED